MHALDYIDILIYSQIIIARRTAIGFILFTIYFSSSKHMKNASICWADIIFIYRVFVIRRILFSIAWNFPIYSILLIHFHLNIAIFRILYCLILSNIFLTFLIQAQKHQLSLLTFLLYCNFITSLHGLSHAAWYNTLLLTFQCHIKMYSKFTSHILYFKCHIFDIFTPLPSLIYIISISFGDNIYIDFRI